MRNNQGENNRTGRISRRRFLQVGAISAAGIYGALCSGRFTPARAAALTGTHEAMFYKDFGEKRVQCQLCPRICVVEDGQRGYCRVRRNTAGTYHTLVYGKPVTMQVDPIEKKPFFHVLPATKSFSLATVGCNIHCLFCQNWQISQASPEDLPAPEVTPAMVLHKARLADCATIAFTYSEPIVAYEYMYDTARMRTTGDPRVVMVSNGFIRKEPLQRFCEVAAAVKIDFKGFSKNFYSTYCDGVLEPVLDTLKTLAAGKTWYEIVTLLLPGLNDSPAELRDMCAWIKDNLGTMVPLHVTRFHPTYRMKNLPPTPEESVVRAHDIARTAGLQYVYVGNLPGNKYENTYCHSCGEKVITR
ncbi:AmmeMemoRadiSam system radical SAM enzyme, partial [bacterium]|nr:AmmeMemoRadiSam system radical SAM enzyme [candidate division CSSED10-310 bacterium]